MVFKQVERKSVVGAQGGISSTVSVEKSMGLTEKQAQEIMRMLERKDNLILFALGKKDENVRFTNDNGTRTALSAAISARFMGVMTKFLAKNAREGTDVEKGMKIAASAEKLADRIENATYYSVEPELLPLMNGQKSQEVQKLLASLVDTKDLKTSAKALWALEQAVMEGINITAIEPALREKTLIPEIAGVPSTSDLKLGKTNSAIAFILAEHTIERIVHDKLNSKQHIARLDELAATDGIVGGTVKQIQHLMGASAFGANPFRSSQEKLKPVPSF